MRHDQDCCVKVYLCIRILTHASVSSVTSLRLSMQSILGTVKIILPAYGKIMVGQFDAEKAESTLRDWARQTVERARMKIDCKVSSEINPEHSYVMMYNHQSYLDIPLIYATVPVPKIRMVAKAELFTVPFWGKALRGAGVVELNRKDRAQAIQSLEQAGQEMRDGAASVVIAPEGTRTSDGSLMPLKKGGFHLAKSTSAEIVPVAISGAYCVLPPNKKRMRYDVPVRMVYGAPIATKDRPIEDVMDDVRAFYKENVDLTMNSLN